MKKGQIVTDYANSSYRIISTQGDKLKVIDYCPNDSIVVPQIHYINKEDIKQVN